MVVRSRPYCASQIGQLYPIGISDGRMVETLSDAVGCWDHAVLRCAEQAREAAARRGEDVPADAFDSNCITPGTAFMDRLGAHLRFFIRKKMEEDPVWQRPRVIFSGEPQSTTGALCST
jgi:XRN 5'-3' exonuclease N-terminus